LRDWTEASVRPALHETLSDQLRALEKLELDVAVVDSSHVRALRGGLRRAPRPSIGVGRVASTT
jgi:hypothetical protein